jgi:Fe-S-cluster containining protein
MKEPVSKMAMTDEETEKIAFTASGVKEMSAFQIRRTNLIFRSKDLLEMVNNYPIIFHRTTPKNFQCIRDCGGCCTQGYYFNDEFEKLPEEYHYGIEEISPVLKHQLRTCNGKCIFYKLEGCQIPDHRPMRCQIFPYKFVVDESKKCIFIFADCFFNDIWGDPHNPGQCSILCPGFTRPVSVENKIKEFVRPYLTQLVLEKPVFLPFHFYENTDDLIDQKLVQDFKRLKKIKKMPYPNRQGVMMLNGKKYRL